MEFLANAAAGKSEPTLPNLLIFHRIIKRFEEKLKGSPTDYLDSISFNGFPTVFFHMAGPLTLYPVTKSAAADELEKRISSVVVKSLTFPELKCFFRSAIAPLLYRNTNRADGTAGHPHCRNAVRLRRNTGS